MEAEGLMPCREQVIEHESPNDTDSSLAESNECDMPTWRLGLLLAFAYSLNYFWRYPIFMLPNGILDTHVVTLFGKELKLQACFSMAFTLGYGFAKVPAVAVISSAFFFANRSFSRPRIAENTPCPL